MVRLQNERYLQDKAASGTASVVSQSSARPSASQVGWQGGYPMYPPPYPMYQLPLPPSLSPPPDPTRTPQSVIQRAAVYGVCPGAP